MYNTPNDALSIATHVDELMSEAGTLRHAAKKPEKPSHVSDPVVPQPIPAGEAGAGEDQTDAEESLHSKIQQQLIQLGLISGLSVWIATNDKNRMYQGKPLGTGCLDALPNLGLSIDATKRMSLIDVIWLRQGAPLYAFEVEATTSIYSGLLRMSDLLASVPALNLHLFVVAPVLRQSKVLGELARPTFAKIGLSEYCGYIPAEELDVLVSKLSGLSGYVQPSVIETLKIAVTNATPSGLG